MPNRFLLVYGDRNQSLFFNFEFIPRKSGTMEKNHKPYGTVDLATTTIENRQVKILEWQDSWNTTTSKIGRKTTYEQAETRDVCVTYEQAHL